ncbi:hypothetical protein [Fervidobacterium sp.]
MANFLADLVNLTLLVSFSMISGAFLGQIAKDFRLRKCQARAVPVAS